MLRCIRFTACLSKLINMAVLPEVNKIGKTFETMAKVQLLQILTISLCSLLVRSHPQDPLVTYDMLYESGIKSYTHERWSECVAYMQSALDDYKFYHDNLATCRINCQNIPSIKADNPQSVDIAFFKYALQNSDCIRRCKQRVFNGRPESVGKKVIDDFAKLKPYNYLQICAYKVNNISI